MILLDEPLSALDANTTVAVRGELQELLREFGLPTLLVTHDYEDAASLADTVGSDRRGQASPARDAARDGRIEDEIRSVVVVGTARGCGSRPPEVTDASLARLELVPGARVVASFKATGTRLVPDGRGTRTIPAGRLAGTWPIG